MFVKPQKFIQQKLKLIIAACCCGALFGCSSLPESQALRQIRVGMSKSEVLNIAGSPKISDRRLNQDRWVYETDDGTNHKFVTTDVFFAHNRVTYVGRPNKLPDKSSGHFQPVGQ